MLYKIDGTVVNPLHLEETFMQGVDLNYYYDDNSDTFYSVLRVFKKKPDGSFQYPFVRQPTSTGTVSAYDLASIEGWCLTINGGIGQGIVIENSTVIVDESAVYHAGAMPLTIDQNGDLGYESTDTAGRGSSIVASGIVSAVCGFFPIIDNYVDFNYPTVDHASGSSWEHAQRQIIGQFSNGDYCIITGEGRDNAHSTGFSMTDAQTVCKKLGLRFAYNLDGGGSTQTVLGLKNVNTVYEGTTGRKVESYIVFNGTDTYAIPGA